MAKNKTAETENDVTDFINQVADETKRTDSFRLIELMQGTTGFAPKMWGASIIGFGNYHYKYASGHEGDMPLVGFSPRKAATSLYLSQCSTEKPDLLRKLGKHKAGVGCIYIKKLDDINTNVLREMVAASVDYLKNTYGIRPAEPSLYR